MPALKSLFKDDGGKSERETSQRIIAKIKAGETLTKDELAFCTLNWAPITQARYLAQYATAQAKKALK